MRIWDREHICSKSKMQYDINAFEKRIAHWQNVEIHEKISIKFDPSIFYTKKNHLKKVIIYKFYHLKSHNSRNKSFTWSNKTLSKFLQQTKTDVAMYRDRARQQKAMPGQSKNENCRWLFDDDRLETRTPLCKIKRITKFFKSDIFGKKKKK